MTGSEGIVGAFVSAGEAAYAVLAPVHTEFGPSACQYLMGICLMGHVEDDVVLRGVEDIVHPHNQFHCAQAAPEVTGVC